jgi:hypothetical protein
MKSATVTLSHAHNQKRVEQTVCGPLLFLFVYYYNTVISQCTENQSKSCSYLCYHHLNIFYPIAPNQVLSLYCSGLSPIYTADIFSRDYSTAILEQVSVPLPRPGSPGICSQAGTTGHSFKMYYIVVSGSFFN